MKNLLNDRGHEISDPTKPEMPLGFKEPESLQNQIQRLVRTGLSEAAHNAGAETFEEAEDFDIEEDDDPQTPYEMEFDPTLGEEVSPDMISRNPDGFREKYVQAALEDDQNHTLMKRAKRKWRPFSKKQEPEPRDRRDSDKTLNTT